MTHQIQELEKEINGEFLHLEIIPKINGFKEEIEKKINKSFNGFINHLNIK